MPIPVPLIPFCSMPRVCCRPVPLGEIYHAKALASDAGSSRRVPILIGTFRGGPLVDIGSHSLHMTLWLANKFDAVECCYLPQVIGRQGGFNPHGPWDPEQFTVEDSAFGFIRFADGSSVTLDASWALHTEKE